MQNTYQALGWVSRHKFCKTTVESARRRDTGTAFTSNISYRSWEVRDSDRQNRRKRSPGTRALCTGGCIAKYFNAAARRRPKESPAGRRYISSETRTLHVQSFAPKPNSIINISYLERHAADTPRKQQVPPCIKDAAEGGSHAQRRAQHPSIR